MDVAASLNGVLEGRYVIERELGAGGMATVYLARDQQHDRRVALKVLRPELTAVIGRDRFLSEIKVTANLSHPHIVPLFDSGEADGLLFYVMPYLEGETLGRRLEREGQLPVDEAVRIAVAIGNALDYAHRQGVIHRDLKPENILIQENQPLIADFGIALAMTNAAGHRLTQTGISLGTPEYMSPEQATADHRIDARTDLYSLAAILYEMLVGNPPHTGNSAQVVVAKMLTERPIRPGAIRESVPAHVDAAVLRGLARVPADRFATAGEFAQALTRPDLATANSRPWSALLRRPFMRAAVASVAIAVLILLAIRLNPFKTTISTAGVDPFHAAILPFDVTSSDPADSVLGVQVASMLAVGLQNDQRLTIADVNSALLELSRTTTSSRPTWRDVHETAARLRAGIVAHGSVHVQGREVVLTASLAPTASGSGEVIKVTGSRDSVRRVVDELAIRFVAQRVGMGAQIAQLLKHPPEAVGLYLKAKSKQRQGITEPTFGAALNIDSTFAYAALGIWRTALWGRSAGLLRAMNILELHRDALMPGDKQMVTLLTSHDPNDPRTRYDKLQEALQVSNDRSFARFLLADELFRQFLRWEIPGGAEEAINRLRQFVRTEPTTELLMTLSSALMGRRDPRDSVELRQIEEALVANRFVGPHLASIRFNAAIGRGDTARAHAMIRDSARSYNAADLIFWGIGGPGIDAIHDYIAVVRNPPPVATRDRAALYPHMQLLTLGAPRRADEMLPYLMTSEAHKVAHRMANVLYSDGDTTGVKKAADNLPLLLSLPVLPKEAGFAWCVLGQWQATRGDTVTARGHGIKAAEALDYRASALCAATIEALIENRRPFKGNHPALHKLDTVLVQHPISSFDHMPYNITGEYLPATITASRLHQQAGEYEAARRAARRRSWNDHGRFTSTMLLLEARNAVCVDSAAQALEAYRHYLALRSRPEPALSDTVARVRTEYEQLKASTVGRASERKPRC